MKLIVSIILSLFLIVVALNKNYSFKEGFASTSPIPITSANIADYIYNVYKADVKAIQNLADVAIKLQEGGITVPGTMTVSNQLNVGGIAEITGATKLKSTMDVTGVAEVTGATKLKSTLDVTGATNMASTLNVIGDITGKTIKELRDKIAALEAKTSGFSADGQTFTIKGSATVAGILITNNGTQFGLGYRNQNDLLGEYTHNKSQFLFRDGTLWPVK